MLLEPFWFCLAASSAQPTFQLLLVFVDHIIELLVFSEVLLSLSLFYCFSLDLFLCRLLSLLLSCSLGNFLCSPLLSLPPKLGVLSFLVLLFKVFSRDGPSFPLVVSNFGAFVGRQALDLGLNFTRLVEANMILWLLLWKNWSKLGKSIDMSGQNLLQN